MTFQCPCSPESKNFLVPQFCKIFHIAILAIPKCTIQCVLMTNSGHPGESSCQCSMTFVFSRVTSIQLDMSFKLVDGSHFRFFPRFKFFKLFEISRLNNSDHVRFSGTYDQCSLCLSFKQIENFEDIFVAISKLKLGQMKILSQRLIKKDSYFVLNRFLNI